MMILRNNSICKSSFINEDGRQCTVHPTAGPCLYLGLCRTSLRMSTPQAIWCSDIGCVHYTEPAGCGTNPNKGMDLLLDQAVFSRNCYILCRRSGETPRNVCLDSCRGGCIFLDRIYLEADCPDGYKKDILENSDHLQTSGFGCSNSIPENLTPFSFEEKDGCKADGLLGALKAKLLDSHGKAKIPVKILSAAATVRPTANNLQMEQELGRRSTAAAPRIIQLLTNQTGTYNRYNQGDRQCISPRSEHLLQL